MLLLIVLIFSGIIVFADYIPLIKRKNKRETAVYSVLFFIGFSILLLYGLGVNFPSSAPLMEKILTKITGGK